MKKKKEKEWEVNSMNTGKKNKTKPIIHNFVGLLLRFSEESESISSFSFVFVLSES